MNEAGDQHHRIFSRRWPPDSSPLLIPCGSPRRSPPGSRRAVMHSHNIGFGRRNEAPGVKSLSFKSSQPTGSIRLQASKPSFYALFRRGTSLETA